MLAGITVLALGVGSAIVPATIATAADIDSLTITPTEWNVVGLDSNDVTDGPNQFPVGVTVCNTQVAPISNLTLTWNWTQTATLPAVDYIGIDGNLVKTVASLAGNSCVKRWWTIDLIRNSNAYDTSRDFTVTASALGVNSVATPADREIFVEHLISQARNAVDEPTPPAVMGPSNVVVGTTVSYTMTGETATQGYEQLIAGPVLDGSIFEVLSVSSTYAVPVGSTNPGYYIDACGWDPSTVSADYMQCDTNSKAGGDPISVTVTALVIATGTGFASSIIDDFSGSSFHYNARFGDTLIAITSTAPAPPVAVDDSAATLAGIAVPINVPSNDTDPDGDLSLTSVTITAAPTHGTTSINPTTGVITYTPLNSTYVGTDTFTYQICDATLACDTAVVTVTITGPPVANDDAASTLAGVAVAISVPSNDTDPDGNLSLTSVSITAAPTHGTTSTNPTTGVITYTPLNSTYVGTDTFTYQICDTALNCDTALVTVTITAAPVANDDAAETLAGVAVAINVPSNDTDADGNLNLASVSIISAPTHGTTSINPTTGVITYTPLNSTFVGTDTFTYEICDTALNCDTALVTVTITAPPLAVDDSAATLSGVPVAITVPSNDTDPDSDLDVASVSIVSGPANGTIDSISALGVVTYTPTSPFVGVETFTYEICDADGNCDSAAVTITVTAPPVAVNDAGDTLTGVAVSVDVTANDSDLDGDLDLASVSIVSGPANGTIDSISALGVVTYTPTSPFVGVDTFTYEICDLAGNCDTATVSITVTGPPVAVDDWESTMVGDPVVVDVLFNDSDPDGDLDVGSVTQFSAPGNGTLTSFNAVTGAITYTPNPGYTGIDTFEYEVCDDDGNCDIAMVTVTISLTDPPVAVNDVGETLTGVAVSIDVVANDSDPDGDLDVSTVSILSGPANGTVDSISALGVVTYTPASPFVGIDTFVYGICDGDGNCDSATVTITVTAPPVAVDDAGDTLTGVAVSVDVTANDSDLDGDLDVSTVSIVSGPANGTIDSISALGVVTYTPTSPFVGVDTFGYEICDDDGNCDTATVTITVTAPPVAVDDAESTTMDVPVVVTVLSNDTDLDGDLDAGSVTQFSAPSNGTLTSFNSVTGAITYTPDSGFTGTDSFEYKVCDDDGNCDTATVTINILAAPAPPVAGDNTASTVGGMPVMIYIQSNDTDPDGDLDPTSAALVLAPTNGTAVFELASLAFRYTPSAGFSGTDSFTYEICDLLGLCATALVTVEVSAAVGLAHTGVDPQVPGAASVILVMLGVLLLWFQRNARRHAAWGRHRAI